jgi:pyruvate/2-oxoglutarate dehydrogenase complex dihydrolipoamide dehydrogenase (E3) component
LRQVEKSGAVVRLGIEATPKVVAGEHPDEIVIAVGAEPVWPDIPGSHNPNVIWAGDVLGGLQIEAETVVVAGTGGMGKEAALHLAQQGKRIEIVELPGGSEADQTANFINVMVLDDYLEEAGARMCADLLLQQITTDSVTVRGGNGQEQALSADAVVLAPRQDSRTATADGFFGLADEVHLVGDCRSPRILFNAIHEGFETAVGI